MGFYPYTVLLHGFEITDEQYTILKPLIDNKYLHSFSVRDKYENGNDVYQGHRYIKVVSEHSNNANLLNEIPHSDFYSYKKDTDMVSKFEVFGSNEEMKLKDLRRIIKSFSERTLNLSKFSECEQWIINPESHMDGGYILSEDDKKYIKIETKISSPEFEKVLEIIANNNIPIPDYKMYLSVGCWCSW